MFQKLKLLAVSFVLFLTAFQFDLSPVSALPSGIPSKATAQSELNALTVKTESTMIGYSRDLFPHWSSQGSGCDTRQVVLKRDADSYVGNCPVTSGSWYSYYDGLTFTNPSDLDIDHVVPLAEAWRSGASSWTTTTRQAFANDLNGPQLIAVSASSNRSKGDQDPSTWKPTRAGASCAYSKMWINTKSRWGLSLQSSEKTALQTMLNTCTY
ncbi:MULTISPECIES: HNH endonuclease family protein [Exiguobacterium]|uniref:HNH endonuclease family protein n=1 Tax=Exiguobacterium antarcticum TaxID=132920 RepID=A0ABT6R3V9_9BACL|nr:MULTISPECIES: HNH endonuclease family protein [Exiguobacterium]AFS71905.1 Secreted protein [Exiguobacterium antarcticum B7]MCT4780261.1 HNH endonuclease family protein [Exiguobacterium soli]MDI3235644.1 HNH endonuclease family protein [Exiguobacterium antarcticum]